VKLQLRLLFATSVFSTDGTVESFMADVVREISKYVEAVYVVSLMGKDGGLPNNVLVKVCPYEKPVLRLLWLFYVVLAVTLKYRINVYLSYISEITSIVVSLAALITRVKHYFWYCSIYTKPRLRVGIALKMAHMVFTCSDFTRELYARMWSVKREKIENIKHGVSVTKFTPTFIPELVLPGQSTRPTIVSVGRFSPVKEWHMLVYALHKIKKQYPSVQVFAIGETPRFSESVRYTETLRDEIRKLSLEDSWVFMGPIPNNQLYKYYNLADVCVFPGYAYKTIIEALLIGRPTLISRKSARIIFGSRLTDNVRLLTFEDEGELAEITIKALKGDPSILDATTKATSIIREEFSMHAFVQRLLTKLLFAEDRA